ncbi:MAG: hypothetical protein ACE15C_18480 [Phycisphaerae bacterium]
MKVFLAGIIQGSIADARIHSQDWRGPIKKALARHCPGTDVYCHFARHPHSITYGLPKIRRTLADGIARAACSDVLVAYLPSASMGTAIEMYAAARGGAVVLTITPMAANWVVRAYSDRVFKGVEGLEQFLASKELAGLIKKKRRKSRISNRKYRISK